jgi:hypothetical protein
MGIEPMSGAWEASGPTQKQLAIRSRSSMSLPHKGITRRKLPVISTEILAAPSFQKLRLRRTDKAREF